MSALDVVPEAPRSAGMRLVTLVRPARQDRAGEELRLVLDEHEGHKFVSLRVWFRGSDGQMYPTRKGATIRRGELYETIRGLCAAARELGVELHPKAVGSPK